MKLRQATKDDCELLFDWANNPQVRANAINTEPIEWEGHCKWFQSKLQSSDKILILEDSIPVGQIRLDVVDNHYLIDYSVQSNQRGKGYGKILLEMVIKSHRDYTLKGEVREDNIGSKKAFERSGFTKTGTREIKGNSYIVYEYR